MGGMSEIYTEFELYAKRWQILYVLHCSGTSISLQPDVQLRWGLDQNVAF